MARYYLTRSTTDLLNLYLEFDVGYSVMESVIEQRMVRSNRKRSDHDNVFDDSNGKISSLYNGVENDPHIQFGILLGKMITIMKKENDTHVYFSKISKENYPRAPMGGWEIFWTDLTIF